MRPFSSSPQARDVDVAPASLQSTAPDAASRSSPARKPEPTAERARRNGGVRGAAAAAVSSAANEAAPDDSTPGPGPGLAGAGRAGAMRADIAIQQPVMTISLVGVRPLIGSL